MTTWSILGHTAKVLEERRDDYGDPAEQFRNIADRWSITLGTPVTPAQVALCMMSSDGHREPSPPPGAGR